MDPPSPTEEFRSLAVRLPLAWTSLGLSCCTSSSSVRGGCCLYRGGVASSAKLDKPLRLTTEAVVCFPHPCRSPHFKPALSIYATSRTICFRSSFRTFPGPVSPVVGTSLDFTSVHQHVSVAIGHAQRLGTSLDAGLTHSQCALGSKRLHVALIQYGTLSAITPRRERRGASSRSHRNRSCR